MSTKAHMAEPRCSFCGRTVAENGCLVSGPDCHICDRCIREAASMVEESATSTADEYPTPLGGDYDRAFEVYACALDPIQDMLERRYRTRTIRALATTIAWCREKEDLDMETAGRDALALAVRMVLPKYFPQN